MAKTIFLILFSVIPLCYAGTLKKRLYEGKVIAQNATTVTLKNGRKKYVINKMFVKDKIVMGGKIRLVTEPKNVKRPSGNL